jgi:hypothetical protein
MANVRPEVTGRAGLSSGKLPELSALELEKNVSVPEAAAIKGVSPWTFKRYYSQLIRKVSPRREVVKLRTLLQEDA